jgi:hypothetical protein
VGCIQQLKRNKKEKKVAEKHAKAKKRRVWPLESKTWVIGCASIQSWGLACKGKKGSGQGSQIMSPGQLRLFGLVMEKKTTAWKTGNANGQKPKKEIGFLGFLQMTFSYGIGLCGDGRVDEIN